MRILLVAAITAASVAAATGAQAHESNTGYWGNNIDTRIWRNSYGQCWETGTITAEQRAAGCEPKAAAQTASAAPAAAPVSTASADAAAAAAKAKADADAAAAAAAAALLAAKDTDGDGVNDAKDTCPDTKAGAKVDATGCYIVLQKAVTINIDVKFPSGSSRIDAAGTAEVEKFAKQMIEYPQTNVEVGGHTDNTGNANTNRRLSQARADAVRKMLIEKFGIEASRLSSVGYGPDKPIADNGTQEGRNKNRRVEGVGTQMVDSTEQ